MLIIATILMVITSATVGCSNSTTESVKQVDVIFELDGGTGGPTEKMMIYRPSTSELTVPEDAPTKADSHFQGWLVGETGTVILPGETKVVEVDSQPIVLTAKWKSGQLEEAPYTTLYMNFPHEREYDVFQSDWMCTIDTEDTYWCTHNWYSESDGIADDGVGYAGFQNVGGKHALILSIWDGHSGNPTIEYRKYPAIKEDDFGNEGTGKHVVQEYPWASNKWYSMRVQALPEDGKTVFELWVKPEGEEWDYVAAISYPKEACAMTWNCAFLEDFAPSNLQRAGCWKNFFAHDKSSGEWIPSTACTLDTMDRASDRMMNIAYDVIASQNDGGVEVQTGGSGYELSLNSTPPIGLSVSQSSEPDDVGLLASGTTQ